MKQRVLTGAFITCGKAYRLLHHGAYNAFLKGLLHPSLHSTLLFDAHMDTTNSMTHVYNSIPATLNSKFHRTTEVLLENVPIVH